MADDDRRQPRVTYLPPQTQNQAQPLVAHKDNPPAPMMDNSAWQTTAWLPSSLARRVLHKVQAKEAAAAAEHVAAVNNVIALCTEHLRLRRDFEGELARFEMLDEYKGAARAKAYAEIEQIFEDIDDQKEERLLQRLNRRASIIEAQRRLDSLQRVPAPALPPPAKESRGSRVAAAIKRIYEERDQVIAVILAGRSEEELDEDERQMVDGCRLAAMRKINALMQED